MKAMAVKPGEYLNTTLYSALPWVAAVVVVLVLAGVSLFPAILIGLAFHALIGIRITLMVCRWVVKRSSRVDSGKTEMTETESSGHDVCSVGGGQQVAEAILREGSEANEEAKLIKENVPSWWWVIDVSFLALTVLYCVLAHVGIAWAVLASIASVLLATEVEYFIIVNYCLTSSDGDSAESRSKHAEE